MKVAAPTLKSLVLIAALKVGVFYSSVADTPLLKWELIPVGFKAECVSADCSLRVYVVTEYKWRAK